ncbi:MAG: hypothetical protein E6Q97_25325 [Desulfurellales bacterium]|nr:MAG: hypothetical protein E6Q97_25325 [Desulfurellales bacterium]
METTWIELRGEGDELHGRLNLATLELMTGRRGRLVCYDLMATVRERRAVVVRVRVSEEEQEPEKKT